MTPTTTTKRALGYTRTSTPDQANRPADDLDRITRWCALYGYELAEFVQDVGVSGSVPLEERPNGQGVHDVIHARRPAFTPSSSRPSTGSAVTRRTRSPSSTGSRPRPTAGPRNHVGLVAIDQHIDLTGPFGAFIAKQFVLFSELDLEAVEGPDAVVGDGLLPEPEPELPRDVLRCLVGSVDDGEDIAVERRRARP
jgi:hypothetical protein